MKKTLLVLMCALMLVSVTACEDKVRDKEDKKTEETKAPQANDKTDDKDNSGLGGKLEGYIDESREATDNTSCDYVKSTVMAASTVEEAYLEMNSKDGKMWLLITFDDGMTFSSEEEFKVLKTELEATLEDLAAPKTEGKVAYLVTWISDTGNMLNVNVETVDATTTESYMRASGDKDTNEPSTSEDAGLEGLGLSDTSMHVFDGANLLKDGVIENLEKTCEGLLPLINTDVVIITVNEYDGDIDDSYDEILQERYVDIDVQSNDVIILDMSQREVRIFSGAGENNSVYLRDEQCTEIYDFIVADLRIGDYEDAFKLYLQTLYDYYR